MPFLDPNDTPALSQLRSGQFALPRPGNTPGSRLLADTPRLRKSMRGIQTLLRNHGYAEAANALDAGGPGTLPEKMERLQQDILQGMRRHLEAGRPDRAEVTRLFHLVQLWGGISGRTVYVSGGGFEQNFDPDAYAGFAAAAAGSASRGEKVGALKKYADQIRGLGVSFATKHARFWAQAGGAEPLPIYDRIIAAGCFGYKTPLWAHYESYLAEMQQHAAQAGTGVQELERSAFVFFDSTPGQRWIQCRKP